MALEVSRSAARFDAVHERGQKLSELGDKSAKLADDAADFADLAKQLRKQSQGPFGWF